MAIFAITGENTNLQLMNYAVENTPCLVIDCANCANPHALPFLSYEKLSQIYLLEVDLIYVYRDIIRMLRQIAKECNTKKIIITTGVLFNYQDGYENKKIYEQTWEMLKSMQGYDILIGLIPSQIQLAKKYGVKIWDTLSGAKELS